MANQLNIIANWNPRNGKKYLSEINNLYGARFFWMMISVYVGIKGALHFFSQIIQLPYYQSAGHDGAIQQKMFAISYVPWSCKGFIGVLSDVLPLFGYQKTTYVIIYTALGSVGCIIMAILPLSVAHENPYIPSLLFFMIFLETAAHDLLMEGKYVQQMNKYPGTKPNLVTFAWFCTLAGQLVPSFIVGPVSDVADVRILFYIMTIFSILPLVTIFFGGMIDDSVQSHQNNRLNIERIKTEWKLMLLATLMALASLGTVFVGIFSNQTAQVIYSLTAAFSMCTLAFFLIPIMAVKFNIYNFLSTCLYVNLQGALEYYYTADNDCVPNGPKFSYSFIKTYGQIVGTFAQFVGMLILQVVMSNWKFRHIFWTTSAIRIGASIFDIILVERWNRLIGIPDKVVYLLGYAVVYQLSYMMDFVPHIILISKLCPKNVEATMFALLAGYGNYGVNTSNHVGVLMMGIFGIKTKVTETHGCNFDNMTNMILIGHGLLPALCIGLVFILIPDAYLHDTLTKIEERNQRRVKPKNLA